MLRRGHLSDAALIDVARTGQRPRHVDQCDLCADRALELSRWLDDLKQVAAQAVDDAFPAERIAAQHGLIMRRLEQTDEPVRVLEFPLTSARPAREAGGRRVAPAWIGVAAAAGLVIGVLGDQWSARHARAAGEDAGTLARTSAIQAASATLQDDSDDTSPGATRSGEASPLDLDLDGFMPSTLRALDEATPRLLSSGYTVASLQTE